MKEFGDNFNVEYHMELAKMYGIKPEKLDDFLKRMMDYNIKLEREEYGGNTGIHKINDDEKEK